MGFAQVFKIFKKGAKAASKPKGKDAGGSAIAWPAGIRVGVYGHANAGKTVYFTVLNEECKIAKDLQISVTDNATSGEFLANFRSIWGLGVTSDVGTMVDQRGEQRFPDPTASGKILQFNTILDRSKKVSVVSYDYPGNSVSISERTDITDKVLDFMTGADGLLFFFDPKTLQAELQTQAHVASFVAQLERLAPLSSRLPIPIGLVITKADLLDGFTGDNQVVLVPPEMEHVLAEDFERFLDVVLSSNRIAGNPAWAGSVRNVLVKLREFLKVVVGRTLDFQVFFVSSTGRPPQKIGTDVGRSIYKPPERITPTGVKEPFYWLMNAVVRNRKISAFRKVARYAAVLSVIWMVVFSIPFLWHFLYLLPKAADTEQAVIEQYGGNVLNTSQEDRRRITSAYDRYEQSWTVKWLFPRFIPPTDRIQTFYARFNLAEAVAQLDRVIGRFSAVVSDSTLWPKLNPADNTLIMTDEHNAVLADLEAFHQGDEKSELYMRSDRTLQYWDIFTRFIANRADTAAYAVIVEQVQLNERTFARDLSRAEQALGQALLSSLKVTTERKVKQAVAQRAGVELDDLIEKINGNPSPAYRLGDAVTELKRLRSQLDPGVDAASVRAIDKYLNEADQWNKRRKFFFKAETIPGQGHLHVEVTAGGRDASWADQSQILQGFEYSLEWKIGDDIHIALDTLGAPEMWGRAASDKKILTGKYALFSMEGEVTFDNLGKTVTIRFTPSAKDRMPVPEK
ncbi:MAG: GTPase domain-containing protein [candidate division Zixibacteria bacterium]|nr:GTPase domain-containing protein [candidate division Zixibacteria bacterium]